MTKLSIKPNEGSTYIITVSFTDFDGVPFTPVTCTWSLINSKGAVQNGRNRVPVTITGSSYNFVLSGDDLVYDNETMGSRIFVIEGTLNSSYGASLPFRDEASFSIKDTVLNAV